MNTLFEETQDALRNAAVRMDDLLNLAQVSDTHPVSRRVAAHFDDLYAALHEVPSAGPAGRRVHDEGPFVYPVAGTDPRNWPTSTGQSAGELLVPQGRRAARLAGSKARLAAPEVMARRRVMSPRQWERCLEYCTPEGYGGRQASGGDLEIAVLAESS